MANLQEVNKMPVDTSTIAIPNSVGANTIYRIDYNGNIKSEYSEPVQVRRKYKSTKWEAVSNYYSNGSSTAKKADSLGKWVDSDILRKQKYRGLKEELAKIKKWKSEAS
jgi:hypothetical protein